MPQRDDVKRILKETLTDFNRKNEHIDTITFAGNGEPTMHPQFAEIIDDVIELRNSICPTTKVSVLSNATLTNKPKIFDALQKIDNNILKLDSGIEDTINIINQPVTKFSLEKTIENLRQFKGELTVQTLFFRGKYKGVEIDNTSDKEVAAWIEAIKKIKPKSVMIYTLDRPTPVKELYKADEQRLKEIAAIVENLGIKTQING